MSNKQSPWRSPWVRAWLSMLVIFFLANAVMIYLAVDRNPGLVVEDFYERGQDYEENMLKRKAADPGWVMKLDRPKFVDVGQPASFTLDVKDRAGAPVDVDGVTVYAYRPSGKEHDFSVPADKVSPGRFQAELTFPLLGVWDILASARLGEAEYHVADRLSAGVK